jgi:predicted dienelactone hydrolase
MMKQRFYFSAELSLFVLLVFSGAGSLLAKGYDPLVVDPNFQAETRDLSVHDAARSRDIPVRIYLPATNGRSRVVLFSHGLGGSRGGSKFLGEQWAARGYVAVFVQHPGSDDAV